MVRFIQNDRIYFIRHVRRSRRSGRDNCRNYWSIGRPTSVVALPRLRSVSLAIVRVVFLSARLISRGGNVVTLHPTHGRDEKTKASFRLLIHIRWLRSFSIF
jgi:hypothetical protein